MQQLHLSGNILGKMNDGQIEETTFINGSLLNDDSRLVNALVLFEI